MHKIIAIIPARSGSKSVKDKNIRLIDGKPMLAYSIEHAKASKYINRILVSTDSEQYAVIAREYGAETPFLRPNRYAMDTSLDLEVFTHALQYLEETENYTPDLVVQLRPTYPIRNVRDIDRMIEIMLEDSTVDSVRTVAPAKEIPYKMWYKDANNRMEPLLKEVPPIYVRSLEEEKVIGHSETECEFYNMPRQQLPTVYYQNANIDCIRTQVITKGNSMSGQHIVGYEMCDNYDIDTEEEFKKAEIILTMQNGHKRFVFDIDGVIALSEANLDYAKAKPNLKMIQIVNQLYAWGNEIILFTARGYVTGIDWEEVTKRHMKEWGVCYHELHFGKPNADYYVDDKMLSMDFLYSLGVDL